MFIERDDRRKYELKDKDGKVKFSKAICSIYHKEKRVAEYIGYAATVIIILVNIILEQIIYRLVEWVGQDTISE